MLPQEELVWAQVQDRMREAAKVRRQLQAAKRKGPGEGPRSDRSQARIGDLPRNGSRAAH